MRIIIAYQSPLGSLHPAHRDVGVVELPVVPRAGEYVECTFPSAGDDILTVEVMAVLYHGVDGGLIIAGEFGDRPKAVATLVATDPTAKPLRDHNDQVWKARLGSVDVVVGSPQSHRTDHNDHVNRVVARYP